MSKSLLLSRVEDAGVHRWSPGDGELQAAAKAADFTLYEVDLQAVQSKKKLLSALQAGLKLPEYFGNNWDALADVLMDSDWLSGKGIVVLLRNARSPENRAPEDWFTALDVFRAAIEFWKDRGKPFWVFVE